jgi:hypothetical protein
MQTSAKEIKMFKRPASRKNKEIKIKYITEKIKHLGNLKEFKLELDKDIHKLTFKRMHDKDLPLTGFIAIPEEIKIKAVNLIKEETAKLIVKQTDLVEKEIKEFN